MKQDMITALSDGELSQVLNWVQAEQKLRTQKHKADTIEKIRELAQAVGISIRLDKKRGRLRTRPASNMKSNIKS